MHSSFLSRVWSKAVVGSFHTRYSSGLLSEPPRAVARNVGGSLSEAPLRAPPIYGEGTIYFHFSLFPLFIINYSYVSDWNEWLLEAFREKYLSKLRILRSSRPFDSSKGNIFCEQASRGAGGRKIVLAEKWLGKQEGSLLGWLGKWTATV